MTKLERWRIEAGLSQRELAARAGVGVSTIGCLERGDCKTRTPSLLKLSNATGLPIMSLAKKAEGLNPIRKHPYRSKTENPESPITCYKNAQSITFEELARWLGNTTRESGRQACAAMPAKAVHIKALAAFEGIGVEAYLRQYGTENGGLENAS